MQLIPDQQGPARGRLVWTKVGSDREAEGSDLADDRSGRFSVAGATLRIERVEVEDRGVYVCTMMAADGSGAMVARASAIVEVGTCARWKSAFRLLGFRRTQGDHSGWFHCLGSKSFSSCFGAAAAATYCLSRTAEHPNPRQPVIA